ncbi:hypothetical protein V6N12_005306 [Hibiscus sabdariffa]|uniref:Uncharacterized protein n=1 Tax=Hibiscus sabdariffa TaxID=183260 RepID=A0ABR2CP27_9ROSI
MASILSDGVYSTITLIFISPFLEFLPPVSFRLLLHSLSTADSQICQLKTRVMKDLEVIVVTGLGDKALIPFFLSSLSSSRM